VAGAAVGAAVAVQLLLFFALGYARTGTYAYGATMVLMVGGGFLVLLVIDTLWNEFAIHRYIRKIRELEDHEQTR